MPLDDRLRNGLRHLADDVHPDVEQRLDEVVGARSRSRRAWPLVVAFAVVAGIAVMAGPIGNGLLGSRAPDGSPTATASRAPSCPTPPEGVLPNPAGTCLGALEAGGTYRSTTFIPPLTYRIPEDTPVPWENAGDSPGMFSLNPSGREGWNAVFLFRDVAPLLPRCEITVDEAVVPTATGLADWMEASVGFAVDARRETNVGGLLGVVLNVRASGEYTTVCDGLNPAPYPPDVPLLPLFAGIGSGDLAWWIAPDEVIRLYLLDLPGGGTVTIAVDAITTDFDRLVEVTEPVIDTIDFDSAYY